MANIFDDPSLWEDWNGNTPPAGMIPGTLAWSTLLFSGPLALYRLGNEWPAGDSLNVDVTMTSSAASPTPCSLNLVVNGWVVQSISMDAVSYATGSINYTFQGYEQTAYLCVSTEGGTEPVEIDGLAVVIVSQATGGNPEPELEIGPVVPFAVSSQLDMYGVEHVHMTPVYREVQQVIPPVTCAYQYWNDNSYVVDIYSDGMQDFPEFLADAVVGDIMIVDYLDQGSSTTRNYRCASSNSSYSYWSLDPDSGDFTPPSGTSGRGTIYNADMSQSKCFEWDVGVPM